MSTARDPWPIYLLLIVCAGGLYWVGPQFLDDGWMRPTLIAAAAGAALTIPFWRGARRDAAHGGRGLAALVFAGAASGAMLVHIGNALVGGLDQVARVEVLGKGVNRVRRSHPHFVTIKAPVPPHGRIDLTVPAGAAFDVTRPGDCMALTWRNGLFGWPVVRQITLGGCPRFRR